MSNTFDVVADTIAEECAVPRDKISMNSHVIHDLGLDSLAFIDICYAIDTKFDIKIPFEEWVNEVNSGKVNSEDVFRLKNIVAEIDKLVAAKGGGHQ